MNEKYLTKYDLENLERKIRFDHEAFERQAKYDYESLKREIQKASSDLSFWLTYACIIGYFLFFILLIALPKKSP